MKLTYRKLAIATPIAVLFLSFALFLCIREVKSEIRKERESRQKLEWQINTIGVAERVEVTKEYDPCGLAVVVCESEEYQLNLQGL